MLLGVIADDLTGANDTGVQFTKKGIQTHVFLDIKSYAPLACVSDVMVWNTDSRALSAEAAKKKAVAAARMSKELSAEHVYKKIDSTLRGNIGAEVDGILDELGLQFAVIAPAFPENGRITVDGIHCLFGKPVAQTEIGRDPKTPVVQSSLPLLLAEQSQYAVFHIGRNVIAQGDEAVQRTVVRQLGQGTRLISFDVEKQDDFAVIISGACAAGKSVLWVGSAALAESLTSFYNWGCSTWSSHFLAKPGPMLAVVGSVSEVTARQVQYFTRQPGVTTILCEPEDFLSKDHARWYEYIRAGQKVLASNQNLILTTRCDRDSIARTVQKGLETGLSAAQVSEIIAQRLGMIVREMGAENLAGMFLTGGDTAVAVCQQLGAIGIEILAEVLPGIPLGRLTGGMFDGTPVVTKAGAFGGEEAIAVVAKTLCGYGE